jgi:protein-L-isoaspartate(D-aspartate) O-methyltransferase
VRSPASSGRREARHTERLLLRGKEIGLRFDDGFPDNPALLTGALDTTRVEIWTGVVIERMVPFDTLQLWLATALDRFGPDTAALAEAMAEQVRLWDRLHRQGPGPRIAAYPAHTPDGQLPDSRVIDKRHVRITISWPPADLPAAGRSVPHHTTE